MHRFDWPFMLPWELGFQLPATEAADQQNCQYANEGCTVRFKTRETSHGPDFKVSNHVVPMNSNANARYIHCVPHGI